MNTKSFFSLGLVKPDGQPFPIRDGDVVTMTHGQDFAVTLVNHHPKDRADVEIWICGRSMGTFRLPPHHLTTIKRPEQKANWFTFYDASSPEGQIVAPRHPTAAQVKIVVQREGPTSLIQTDSADESPAGGVVGLSRSCHQNFLKIPALTQVRAEVIELSLSIRLPGTRSVVLPLP